jgi:hypothetical protein
MNASTARAAIEGAAALSTSFGDVVEVAASSMV